MHGCCLEAYVRSCVCMWGDAPLSSEIMTAFPAHPYVCVCALNCMYVCICVCTYIHMYIHTDIHIYVHTHIHTHAPTRTSNH